MNPSTHHTPAIPRTQPPPLPRMAFAVAIGSVLATMPLRAQGRSDTLPDVAAARADSLAQVRLCERAERIVSLGHPARSESWAVQAVAGCGAAGGTALAKAVRALRAETDTAVLERLTGVVRYFRDGQFFVASAQVAADPQASPVARVFAIRTLAVTVEPTLWYAGYGSLASPPSSTSGIQTCVATPLGHALGTTGAPLPADAPMQAAALVRRIAADSTAPPSVRAAAACTLRLTY